MKSLSRSLALSFLSVLGVAVITCSAEAQSPPLWANDRVPNQFPARNAVPGKDDPPLPTDNGHDNPWQDKLRHLAQISDDQTSQDTGDPVSPILGIVSHRVVDLFIPGRGLDFSFERRYNSKSSATDGPLGYGWDHCYHARTQVVNGTGGAQVMVNNGNDRQDLYTWTAQGSNIYNSPAGVYTLLKCTGSQSYVLRDREGVKSYFDSNVLTKIQDPNGNAITFTYNATHDHIDYVIDTMGRRIDFTYDTNGRLASIQDFRGRQVVYTYDANGNLTGVRTPTVTSTGTPPFNDFPVGRTEHYTYLSGNNNLLDHKLASIIRPNDAAQSTPSVRFYYDTSSSSVFFGWCTSQILGGTNAAGSAGGTITYTYSVLDYTTPVSDSNALKIERLKGHVEDRKGNVRDYYTNQDGQIIRVVDYDGSTPYTTLNEYNADGELTKITQPRNNYTTIAYQDSIRNLDGNIASIKYFPGGISSDQTERDESFEYEPIFNNLCAYTDSNNHVTLNYTDYQEGTTSAPNDVIPALQTELLDIYTRSQVLDLLSGLTHFSFQDQDLNGDGQQAIAKGNIVKVVYPEATISSLGGAPLAAIEGDVYQQAFLTKAYNAYGQVTSQTDEEENVSVNLYYPESDPDGDGIPTTGTGLNTVTGGYLKRVIVDTSLPYSDSQLAGVAVRNQGDDIGRDSAKNPTPVNKVTDYKYDASGNVVSMVDPRGVKYEYSVNELDETWQEKRATDVTAAATRAGGINGATEDLTGQAFAYDTLRKFDANGNVIAEFVQNAGEEPDGVAVTGAPGSHWETYWTYDILDNVRSETREYDFSGHVATWMFGYDPNENRTSVTFPEGNSKAYTWDARDQMELIIRGSAGEASQVQFYRDSNGNLRQYKDGRGKYTVITYDGFDRVTSVVTPIGTEKRLTYDAQSNCIGMSMWGHPSGSYAGPNLELQRFTYSYDERDRQTKVDRQDPQSALTDGTLTPGDGKVSTVTNYDRLNRPVYIIDDDSSKTERLYDGASRKTKETDPVGNMTEYSYDDDDNQVKAVEKDIYPNTTYRQFETYGVFDALNRKASDTDNIGRTWRLGYDSRDNVVSRSDAVASLSSQSINGRQINNPGNTTSRTVDGLERIISERSELRVGGTGDGALDSPPYNLDGRITRTYTYDRNSRLTGATDDDGNLTQYQYDTADRLRTVVYADLTQFIQTPDGNDNIVFWQDAVGNQVTNGYDDGNRLITVNATAPASAVEALSYEYDGLGRLTNSTDSVDSLFNNGDDWINEYTWDALNHVKTQRQNNRTVTTAWREEGKKTSIGYTSGVTVQYTYDALERAKTITQGVQLATFEYAGKDRLLQRADYAGVAQRYHDGNGSWNDTAYYDGARRPIKEDFKLGGALITGIEQGFDRADNRLYTRRLHDSSKGDNFVYDSAYRLTSWERDVPAASVGFPGGTSFDARLGFDLDGADSRHRTTRQTSASQPPVPTVNTVTSVHNYATKQKGIGPQYTTWHQTFDLNGNKTTFTDLGPHPTYQYDFLNRLRVIQLDTQHKVEFDYDAQGKRVRTKVTGLPGYPANTEYVHDGQEVIEELNGTTGVCLRRFYFGSKLDELVEYENLSFFAHPGSYFYEQDSTGNVVAIHDTGGSVVERYNYGAFGSPFFETAANVEKTGLVQSDYGNPYLFKGLRFENYYDPLYYVRARFLDCNDGSFMQRDPKGIWGDLINLGNPKGYCAANPVNLGDPLGRDVYSVTWDVGPYECGTHYGLAVTEEGKAPGDGPTDKFDGMPDNTGHCTVDESHGPVEGAKAQRIPPPPGVTEKEWDDAVREAAKEVEGELGKRNGSQKGTATKKFPKSPGGHVKNRLVPRCMRKHWDCWDVYDEIIHRAIKQLDAKGKIKRRDPWSGRMGGLGMAVPTDVRTQLLERVKCRANDAAKSGRKRQEQICLAHRRDFDAVLDGRVLV